MCSHFEAVRAPQTLFRQFGVSMPVDMPRWDIWPGYESVFIRRPQEVDTGDSATTEREACTGLFGMVPHWAKDAKGTKYTYNARSETIAEKPSFRDAWRRGNHCIIPAAAIFEPDWRSGKALATRIERADGEPLGIAGLWASWRAPTGEKVMSFTMLTINADEHSFMRDFHKAGEEKRMVVILPEAKYKPWLAAGPRGSGEFLNQFPADRLKATIPTSSA